jgi:anti-anti-sigma factor
LSQERGEVAVVAPAGRIDANTAAGLERAVFQRLNAGEARLVVDLAGVEYMSSAGLRVLLKAASAARSKGGALVLCAMGPSVREVVDLAGLAAVFAIEDSRERALARAAEGA